MKSIQDNILINETSVKALVLKGKKLVDLLIIDNIYDQFDMTYIYHQYGIMDKDSYILIDSYDDYRLMSINESESETKYLFRTYQTIDNEHYNYYCDIELILSNIDFNKNDSITDLTFRKLNDSSDSSDGSEEDKEKILFGYDAKKLFYLEKYNITDFINRCYLISGANKIIIDKYYKMYLNRYSKYELKVLSINDSYLLINPISEMRVMQSIQFPINDEFELDLSVPNSVDNVIAIPFDRIIKLYWDNNDIDNDISYTRITYIGKDHIIKVIKIPYTGKNIDSYLVENLNNGEEYTFTLTQINTHGNLSNEVVLNCTPIKNIMYSIELDSED